VRVLLIRLRLIGDVVLSTPVIRALRRAFPEARLSYLVERDAAAVVTGNPHLDEVLIVERSRGLMRVIDDLRLAWMLRRRRFDVVIDMHGGPRSSWLALASGAPRRIGYDMPGRQWLYTRTVGRPRELRPRHSVLNQWDLLGALDGWEDTTPDPARDAVEMPLDAAADARIEIPCIILTKPGRRKIILFLFNMYLPVKSAKKIILFPTRTSCSRSRLINPKLFIPVKRPL
jgi:ADP-heptose:LPS heptosyltransferase